MPADKKTHAPVSHPFTAPYGWIRRGRPHVAVRGPRDVAETEIRFALYRGKSRAGVISLMWPTDFAFNDPETPDEGVSVLDAFSSFKPISAIQPELGGEVVPTGRFWGLVRMYATSQKDFIRIFFRRRTRTQDRETQLFAARQILDHYDKDQSHRCVAAVVQGYRAIDLGDLEAQKVAARQLAAELKAAPELPLTGNPRTDREHLTVSMGFTLWQLYLAAGNYKAFLAQLDDTVAFLKSVDLPFPGIILNGCSTLFARAFVHLIQGQPDEAQALARFNAEFYCKHLPRLPKKAIWFKENLHSLQCVAMGLEMNERIRADLKPFSATTVIATANRVNHEPAREVLAANFSRFCRGLRKMRKAPESETQPDVVD
jgi:hypothetical protein